MTRVVGPAILELVCVCALLAGCDRGPGTASEAVPADTGAMDGLSGEQIQEQVRPMSPEEAAQLGIFDSTAEAAPPAPVGPSPVIPGTPPPVPVPKDSL